MPKRRWKSSSLTLEKSLSEVDRGVVRHREDKQDNSFFGGANPFSKWMSRKLRRRGKCVEVPVPVTCVGVHVDGNDNTARHCVRGTSCGQVLGPWTGAVLKVCDVGRILPASHERVGNHVL